MPHLTTLAAVFAGFFAGLVGFQLFTRGLRLLHALVGGSPGEPTGLTTKRQLWAVPLIVLHPGLWALVGIPYLGYLAYSGRVQPIWGWFVFGFCLGVVALGGVVVLAFRKIRRRRSHATGA